MGDFFRMSIDLAIGVRDWVSHFPARWGFTRHVPVHGCLTSPRAGGSRDTFPYTTDEPSSFHSNRFARGPLAAIAGQEASRNGQD